MKIRHIWTCTTNFDVAYIIPLLENTLHKYRGNVSPNKLVYYCIYKSTARWTKRNGKSTFIITVLEQSWSTTNSAIRAPYSYPYHFRYFSISIDPCRKWIHEFPLHFPNSQIRFKKTRLTQMRPFCSPFRYLIDYRDDPRFQRITKTVKRLSIVPFFSPLFPLFFYFRFVFLFLLLIQEQKS